MSALAVARDAYERHEWQAACDAYAAAHRESALAPDDCERLAWALRWAQDVAGFLDWLERAEVGYSASDERRGAARMALEQARQHKYLRHDSAAIAAHGRALGYLEGLPECPEHAQALWSVSYVQLEQGDQRAAAETLHDALGIARRTGDTGVQALVLQGLAHIEVANGRRPEALALVDEATALAMSPTAAPVNSGHVYCSTISICRALCDWERASEWTDISTRWCQRESITGYSGLCRFHRAEIERFHGRLEHAEAEVLGACNELLGVNPYSAAWGFSELVEIRVRRGDLAGAEEALRRAVELGSHGQPGRARLELARGDVDAAVRGLERSLADPGFLEVEARVFVLPVAVTAAIAAGDLERATELADELERLAGRLGADAPAAAAAVSRGEIELARGAGSAAVARLDDGVRRWCAIDAPYEAAQARVLLVRALRADGDAGTADLQLDAAVRTFTELGAARDARLASRLSEHASDVQHGEARSFLFSDIVASTQLVEAMGDDAWASLLSWHDRTLREAFEAYAGEEVKHAGDGFFVTFDDADAALDCACEIQRRLAEHRRDHGFAPRVRIGLHHGTVTERDGDYFGGAVNQAARIGAQAGADEVLVSTTLLDACARDHPVTEHRSLELKGFAEPVQAAVLAIR